MRIGVDISSLQGAHRMRGIGYTTTNFLENLPADSKDTYVFFLDSNGTLNGEEVFKSINLKIKNYTFQYFVGQPPKKMLPWRFRSLSKLMAKLSDISVYRTGDKRYDTTGLDAFIQFDQNMPLPRPSRGTKNYFIAYDLIPYILEKDYLITYHGALQKGLGWRAAVSSAVNRYAYLKKVELNCAKADGIIAISEATKRDYLRYCKVAKSKISVVQLGVSDISTNTKGADGTIDRYQKTSWGYLSRPASLKGKEFLLFVGGADERRRLHDLVAAFNHLKAQGSDLKLVLSGDIMKGPLHIPSQSIQKALLHSSYINDIYFVGFTDNMTRNWLYKHATAFVFPSVYEGFGLPILEAMSLKTPVICYKNRAVEEVAGDIPFYAHDTLSLIDRIREVQSLKGSAKLEALLEKGIQHSAGYSWDATVRKILARIHR